MRRSFKHISTYVVCVHGKYIAAITKRDQTGVGSLFVHVVDLAIAKAFTSSYLSLSPFNLKEKQACSVSQSVSLCYITPGSSTILKFENI